MNDDVRSPGSGSTPGPLSAQPPPGLGDPDPGKSHKQQTNPNPSINRAVKVATACCVQLAAHSATLQLVIFARYHRSADFSIEVLMIN